MITVTICRTEHVLDDETGDTCIIDSESSVERLEFRELVRLMVREYRLPSTRPASASPQCWLSDGGDTDYRTGNYFERTLHYSDTDSKVKYWALALRAASIIK